MIFSSYTWGSPPPEAYGSPSLSILPIFILHFYSTVTFLHFMCPHHFFIYCSNFYSAVTFLHLHLRLPTTFCSAIFILIWHLHLKVCYYFLFCQFLFHQIFILPIFIPLFIPLWPFCTYTSGSPSPEGQRVPTTFYSTVTNLHLQLSGGSPSPGNIICNEYYYSKHSEPQFQPIAIVPFTSQKNTPLPLFYSSPKFKQLR